MTLVLQTTSRTKDCLKYFLWKSELAQNTAKKGSSGTFFKTMFNKMLASYEILQHDGTPGHKDKKVWLQYSPSMTEVNLIGCISPFWC
jgi:hypothetical protein